MGTPNDPTGRPSSAKLAVPVPSSADPARSPAPEKPGSTDSHRPTDSLSDLILNGSSAVARTTGSDIAQFLAHPQGGGANTDDAPTVITKNVDRGGAVKPVPAAVPVEAPSIAGRRLGHFELIEAVGSGGMAAVLRARDLELNRIVALKILPPEAARDPESVTRFKQEARSAAKLDHENVARVYFCGEDQGLNFIAFEFVEGDNLRVVIDRRGRLPAAECVRYMVQVAAGLSHAAERGVVHRDIKPSNIIITPDGRAKIVDMGLARYLGSEPANGGVTQSGVTLGTFDYISPEQALDPRRADARSDIYSLGCTFYHALTGRPPVPEGTAARKLRAHQEDDFLDPRELNPAIPDELAAILARMVAKDPAARYQSPSELIAHLKGLAERLNVADAVANDPAARAVRADPRVLPQPLAFRPWWVLAVAAVALAAAAFVVSTADPGPAPGWPGAAERPKDAGDPKGLDPVAGTKGGPFPARPPAPEPPVVKNDKELVEKLEDRTTTKIVLAPGTFDLSQRPVTFQGKQLELVAANPGQTRVRLAAGALALKAQAVAVRGVWFDILPPAHESLAMEFFAPTGWTGLRIEEAETVELTECVFRPEGEFLRRNPGLELRAVSLTRAPEGRAPKLALTRCLFSPGVVGVALPAGAGVTALDCGFAPHAAALRFDNSGEAGTRSEARLDRCSFMLDDDCAAVEAASDVSATATECVFSAVYGRTGLRPISFVAPTRGAVVRVREGKLRGVQLTLPAGHSSAFFNVNPVGTADRTLTFEECRTAADGPRVEDKGRVELAQRPWAKSVTGQDPVAQSASVDPWPAFKLAIGTDPLLFTPVTPDQRRTPEPLGAAFNNKEDRYYWVHRAYPEPEVRSWPPPRPQSSAEVREKVWYPDWKPGERIEPGEFTDLRKLLKEARPDDIILVKHTGDLPVDRIELKTAPKGEGDLRVTFKPHPGYAPTFVVADELVSDRTLFKLLTGEVTFEGLTFRLKPNKPRDGQTVAAVAIIGGKSCTFRKCVFTLAEEDDSRVAVAHLPDPERVMKMDATTRPVPQISFDHCVVRGKGRAVWLDVSRPINLELTDTLTALDGPVFFAQAGGDAAAAPASRAKLVRVTALVGGPLVEMRGGRAGDAMRGTGLVKLDVEADDCLFADVPYAGQPLVRLEGVDLIDWKSVFAWRVPAKPNRYANFDSFAVVAQIRAGGDGGVKELGWDDWVSSEPASTQPRLGKVKFAVPPAGLKELAAVKPSDLVVESATFPDPADAKGLPSAPSLKIPPAPEEPKPE